ncbi:GNAT family N-acetyltransferase [Frateuria aurantia]|uniref:Acetyltransferase n=1 Tax=Frateuria aurantia (strain ATCC 33424 / DSM 6220 / KCTC 2777 / LMG 1558 / NBRC 3245 / NCIMB 13370) TaxID=767434 RepID=H8KYU5_FRAAD|nr:GNAT family N-acetyltransferase [Frateuria aurantia]AFC86166.1 acetyltransferase [Frateuria aurantia DSM 6220]
MTLRILDVTAADASRHLPELGDMLAACVRAGGSIGFMQPLPAEQAEACWQGAVLPELEAGRRCLLVAELDGRWLGSVQILLGMPANQSHRCELAKMMVHPSAWRQGIGRRLLRAALDTARRHGRTLITLDTRQGDASEHLYRSMGFEVGGVIPGYALDPDGGKLHATTYMYCRLQSVPPAEYRGQIAGRD